MGISRRHGLGSQDRLARLLPLPGGFLFDARLQAGDPVPVLLLREAFPAGQGREVDGQFGSVVVPAEALAPPAGGVLLGAAEPIALQRLAVQDGGQGVDARPVPDLLDQSLLDTLRGDIAEDRHLLLLLVADDDRGVAPGEHRPLPVGEPVDLLGEVAVEVLHEAGQQARVVDVQQQMQVVRKYGDLADPDRMESLRLTEDADDGLVELRAGAEEIPPLHRPAGDMDQGLRRRG